MRAIIIHGQKNHTAVDRAAEKAAAEKAAAERAAERAAAEKAAAAKWAAEKAAERARWLQIEYPLPYPQGSWPDTYDISGSFPDGFIWGMGTASYQVEGAYREDGRGASIWDTYTGANTIGMPGANCSYCCKVAPCEAHWAMKDKGATGNVAADHYHMYKTDVALMQSMGLKHYRFSISWSRLIPTGRLKDGVNHQAIQWYKNLINELEKAGITPYVTIYHWDLPQGLLDPGRGLYGWWSRDAAGQPDNQIMSDWLDYANLCYTEFGDRIKFWITFNEPWSFLFLGSGYGKAPSLKELSNMSRDPWIGAHTVLNAHAQAVKLYRTKFQPKQKGTISMTFNSDWREPKTSKPEDVLAAEQVMLFTIGWFAEPIFGSKGDYPHMMREVFGAALPAFSAEERALLKGSADFFGFNHYGTGWISYDERHAGPDKTHAHLTEGGLLQGGSDWLFGAAWGFRKVLNWIKRRYNNPPVVVTESGWSSQNSNVEEAVRDRQRVEYYANYTSEMQRAIYQDGCDIRGYFAWSFLDNFEWENGYKERFGTSFTEYAVRIDPSGPAGFLAPQPSAGDQLRRRKESSCYLEALWTQNKLLDPSDPALALEGCVGSREFHGEFKDPDELHCTRLIDVHAPGTAASLYDGCGKELDLPAGVATLSGSTIVADFSAKGGPSRMIGFWSAATSSIVWSDGRLWTKMTATEKMRVDFAFRLK